MSNNTRTDLAPDLLRQRVIIEATTQTIVTPPAMKDFLIKSADILNMEVLSGPFAYTAHDMGYGGRIHRKSSGSHIYSYPTDLPLLTIDTYTCKPFDPIHLATFVQDYFQTIELVRKEV